MSVSCVVVLCGLVDSTDVSDEHAAEILVVPIMKVASTSETSGQRLLDYTALQDTHLLSLEVTPIVFVCGISCVTFLNLLRHKVVDP